LVLAAIIGIIAQKLEYDLGAKASAAAKEKDDLLLGRVGILLEDNKRILGAADQNLRVEVDTNRTAQNTLEGIKRSLEKLDDSIVVHYAAEIPLEDFPNRGAGKNLGERIQELAPDGKYSDEHTDISPRRARSGDIVYVANFDRKSTLMPQNQFLSLELSNVAFEVEFYKTKPQFAGDCFKRPAPDARYVWYELPTASVSPTFHIGETHLETPTLSYITGTNFILQSSLFGTEFRLNLNSGRILSLLDFSQTYLRVAPPMGEKIKVVQFSVAFGHHRPFSVPIKQFVEDKCGGFTYRLPKFTDEDVAETELPGQWILESYNENTGYTFRKDGVTYLTRCDGVNYESGKGTEPIKRQFECSAILAHLHKPVAFLHLGVSDKNGKIVPDSTSALYYDDDGRQYRFFVIEAK
jgi:hypothetical protein